MKIYDKIQYFYKTVKTKKNQIFKILTQVETSDTARDEIRRFLDCLISIDKQFDYIESCKVYKISTYLPLNQPLYSLLLFVFIPSLMAKIVYFRPPVRLRNIDLEILNLFPEVLKDIICCPISRKMFFDEYVFDSNVVIFTGEYINAMKLLLKISDNILFIFNGSALNPILVTQTADIKKAVDDSIQARLYNSGQDCMAPSAIFLHQDIVRSFIEEMIKKLIMAKAGRKNLNCNIGKMLESKSMTETKKIFSKYEDRLIFGGNFNEIDKIINPTIFKFDKPQDLPQLVIYAPIFFIAEYSNINQVTEYLSTPKAQNLSGYISIYTKEKQIFDCIFQKLIIIYNQNLFKWEDGNKEFGGRGEHCSFVSYNGVRISKPILISREIAMFFNS
ncbi:MAG: hypothetical protein CVV52_04640 [Spirochaetae bacterium HGW-Spirochaetae-8]|jgi:hypothetical protein|nr:MAG: hypothetical protein CVV52_04640 [Spirochaetae bacterium HGW-Spirochaetae-8]